MQNGAGNNGNAGAGRTGAQVERSEKVSAGRVWYGFRAYIDTLCENDRSTERVEGLDRPAALRAFANVVDDSIALLVAAAALARAEAIDLERGANWKPLPAEETSETRRARAKAEGREDSQTGRKRS